MLGYGYKSRKISEKMVLKNIFSSWWIIQFLEKLWKMWENIKTLQEEEGIN